MTEWLWLAVGVVLGGAVAWALARAGRDPRTAAAEARAEEVRQQVGAAERQIEAVRDKLSVADRARAAAEARATEIERQVASERALLDEAKARLSDTFKSLAADALAGNSKGFLQLAEQTFKALKDEADGSLDSRQKAIDQLLQPLRETLATYQRETQTLEERRVRELSAVGEQLRQLAQAQLTLQHETGRLVTALRTPAVRGRWGEIALRRTAELAGMSRYCDFDLQQHVTTEDGFLRPDMVVRLPAGRTVVVDSKVPADAYLEAMEAPNDSARDAALVRHAAQVRQIVNQLASKEYWDQFDSTPEFVVLFIPSDSFLVAAAEKDPTLVEVALGKKVVIATPATFIALLRAIAYGWRQELVNENAQRISTLAQELGDRMGTLVEHFGRVGGSLGKAVQSYNEAVASFETRLLPSVRKFKELGAGGKREVDELEQIERTVRELGQPELPGIETVEDTD